MAGDCGVVNPESRATYSFLVLAECGVDDTHIEEDLAGVADLVEFIEGVVEFVVVVAGKGGDPGLDLLLERHGG